MTSCASSWACDATCADLVLSLCIGGPNFSSIIACETKRAFGNSSPFFAARGNPIPTKKKRKTEDNIFRKTGKTINYKMIEHP